MSKKPGAFAAKKSLGQHFLNNARVPALMADAARIVPGDTVLEIGPGTGVLTRELLSRGAKVIAVEADLRAVHLLEELFAAERASGQLSLIHVDMRVVRPVDLGIEEHAYKVVANIPYYLSGKLFRDFLESTVQPEILVFLVQKEVAERIARDTKESLLSLGVRAFGDPTYVKTVARGNFTPAPKVDSAIVRVSNISHNRLAGVDERLFFELLRAGFGSKRKQLVGNLSGLFERSTLESIFAILNIDAAIRAEDIPLSTWISLVRALSPHRKSTS